MNKIQSIQHRHKSTIILYITYKKNKELQYGNIKGIVEDRTKSHGIYMKMYYTINIHPVECVFNLDIKLSFNSN